MTTGMISAAQPEAVEAGLDTLRDGGNAVDAAIATALVQTAVDPQMCGIAGFGSMQLYLPGKGFHGFLDFHGRSPLATRPDMWEKLLIGETEDGFGFILKDRVNELGYGAITSPMTLRALDEALKRHGTMPLARLLEPAIRYAEEGFAVRPHVSAFWNQVATEGRVPHAEMLTRIPATRKIYVNGEGRLRGVGEILKNPDMGKTLRRIAAAGVDDFYKGDIARRMVADMKANGGLLGQADLDTVKVDDNAPLRGTYRGIDIATSQPPGGGILILEMLNILENFDLKAMGHNSPRYIATVSEAMKIATVDKDNHIGDPRFVDVPVARLTSKPYAAEMAERIRSGKKTHVPRLNTGAQPSADTTQVCAVDRSGNIVSLTHTLGQPSGVVTDGLGFMYNGAMSVFDPRPGRTGSLAPGKSRFSAMSPTILFRDGKPFLVVGAPGGTYITMGILQVILNVVEFGMNALEAVSAPRFCTTSDVVSLTNRILRRTEAELQAMGYPTRRHAVSYHFAGVHAIRITEKGLDGGADPGRDGMAMAV